MCDCNCVSGLPAGIHGQEVGETSSEYNVSVCHVALISGIVPTQPLDGTYHDFNPAGRETYLR